MLSVLYALLEGLSREMGIERTDIKGCLFYTSVDGCMIFSVVLYDAVAGGAGHVRRIVTADGQAFQRVPAKAISVVDNCDCDTFCQGCLRTFFAVIQNQTLDFVAHGFFARFTEMDFDAVGGLSDFLYHYRWRGFLYGQRGSGCGGAAVAGVVVHRLSFP